MATLTSPLTLTDTLSHLIRLRTLTHDQAATAAALDWIEAQLEGLPLHINRLTNQGYPCLIATTPAVADPKHPRLWLASHVDVVPGSPDDFRPHVQDGRLIGRGAYDMKYAVACYLHLLQTLGDDLADYDLGLMLTTDEEDSGAHGTDWLVNELGYRGQAVLLPECGTSWTIETGSKGIMKWQLLSTGQAGHASRPWNGLNAIDQLTKFIDLVKTNVPAEPCGDADHVHCTVNLGQISGGAVANQIPGTAEALVDVRLAPGTTPGQAKQWFADAARQFPGVQSHCLFGTAAVTNPAGGPVQLFTDLTRRLAGRSLTPMLAHGSSDGRFFAAHGIPVISVPPTGGNQHAAGEWIDLADLELYNKIVQSFADQWAGPGRTA